MPKVNENCTEIIFKILPHYRDDLLAGNKKIDFRRLTDKWFTVARHAERIRFVCEGKPDVLSKLTSIENLSPDFLPLLKKIYADIIWDDYCDSSVYVFYLGPAWEDKDGD